MKPYFVFHPVNWRPGSNGLDVWHWLCSELNTRGEDAYLFPCLQKPNSNTKLITQDILESNRPSIMVSPEWKTHPYKGTVNVQWMLSYPKKTEGNTLYFSWAKEFYDAPILRPELYDETIFYDADWPRVGHAYYFNKIKKEEGLTGFDLLSIKRGDKQALADCLRQKEYLLLPEVSALDIEAALCGCPTKRSRSESLESAIEQMKLRLAQYEENKKVINQQIENFISTCKSRC